MFLKHVLQARSCARALVLIKDANRWDYTDGSRTTGNAEDDAALARRSGPLSSAVRPPHERRPDVHATSIHRRCCRRARRPGRPRAGASAGGPGRLARAQRARDLADRNRRPGPELPALRRAAQGYFRAELRAREYAG